MWFNISGCILIVVSFGSCTMLKSSTGEIEGTIVMLMAVVCFAASHIGGEIDLLRKTVIWAADKQKSKPEVQENEQG